VNGHGGKRQGAGRRRGARNKRPSYQAVQDMLAGKEQPLDFLLGVMRSPDVDLELRILCAKAAAPYMHRVLKSVEHAGERGGPVQAVVRFMTEEEAAGLDTPQADDRVPISGSRRWHS
jgi:hypothetical protein